jgi:NAD(P)-dependent dehydrogenase (short-subunit alcohol dehydrogenase family)
MQLARFAGSVVVITGGASGLGRGIAAALARAGARLVIGDINVPAARPQPFQSVSSLGE